MGRLVLALCSVSTALPCSIAHANVVSEERLKVLGLPPQGLEGGSINQGGTVAFVWGDSGEPGYSAYRASNGARGKIKWVTNEGLDTEVASRKLAFRGIIGEKWSMFTGGRPGKL